MKKEVLGFNKQKIGEINLGKELTNDEIKQDCLYYKYTNENSNIHIGTAFKKSRALVRGGGVKPWKQKGTGRARAGSKRSPIFRGGGVIFGNQRKNYKFHLPWKIKYKGILTLFNIKFKQNRITIIDEIKLNSPRFKEFKNLFINFSKFNEKIIIVVNDIDENLRKAVRNVENIQLVSIKRMVIRNLINDYKIFITREAVEYLNTLNTRVKKIERFKKIKENYKTKRIK